MALATDPGSTGIPYLTAGVFALSVGITIVNSGNSITMGTAPFASTGTIRGDKSLSVLARNNGGSADVGVIAVVTDVVAIGDSTVAAGTTHDSKTGSSHIFKINGVTEYTMDATTFNMSTNILSMGATPAVSGDMRVDGAVGWQLSGSKSGAAGTAVTLFGFSGNNISIGDQSNSPIVTVQSATSVRVVGGGFTIQLQIQNTSPQLQLATGQDTTIQPLTNATAATGIKVTVKGQNRTASTGTSVGGANEDFGGDASGATATHTGGRRASVGGSATGGSGTRRGGDHWLGPGTGGGTGTSGPGNMYFGKTDPVSFNYQSMTGGLAIENVTDAPTGNPTGAHYYWSDSGTPAWRNSAGDICIWTLTTSASASAGGTQAVPATVVEYMTISYKGNVRKIPLFPT